MKLTEKQQAVLDELRKIGRKNAYLYRDTQPYLHQNDCEKLAKGDQACVFGMGGADLSGWAPPRDRRPFRAEHIQGAQAKRVGDS